MFGRNGEAPVPIVAPRSPSDCFDAAIEAGRIATKYRTPVFLLSDGYLANGSEPWRVPDVDDLPDLRWSSRPRRTTRTRTGTSSCRTCATPRRWPARGPSPAPPGSSTASAASRRPTARGNISYDPANHDLMVRPRRPRSTASPRIPPLEVDDPTGDAARARARLGLDVRPDRRRRAAGSGAPAAPVAQAHLRHLNPFPANLGEVLRALRQGLVPEMNLGQLALLLRGRYLVDAIGYNRVRGLPFKAEELADVIQDVIASDDA